MSPKKPHYPKKIPGHPNEWICHAESDIRLARLGIEDESVYLGQICFHAQQAAEKAIKAVLLFRGIDFPLIHDIEELLVLAEQGGVDLPDNISQASKLSPYAVETRYPGSWMEIFDDDVDEALQIAEDTITWAKKMLLNDSEKDR